MSNGFTVDEVLARCGDIEDLLKDEAIDYFNAESYDIAAELYTRCIELNDGEATYYYNRCFAYLRLEIYGWALADANKVIDLDPTFIKGYDLRASAYIGLALADYDTVGRLETQTKFDECQKIVRRIQFEKAISSDHAVQCVADTIRLEEFMPPSDYAGPRWNDGEPISLEFMLELIDTFKDQKKLHSFYAYKILWQVRKIWMKLPSLVHITVPAGAKITICGDIHGQFYDLCNIFKINGLPSEENLYLFNGDFVDRGSFSVETIFTLFGFKLLFPQYFFMSRGNHESAEMNKKYGFEGEVKSKYTSSMAEEFTATFNYLPLCHVINNKVFVCHGGLFKEDGVTLDEIARVDRVCQPPKEGIMCDLLWSDPQESPGRWPSKRGIGILFGPDITAQFLRDNDLAYVVRSHEVKMDGWECHHNGLCYTIFSAPNYCDTKGNKGAFLTITGDKLDPPHVTEFVAVPHPPVKSMAYASSFLSFLS